MDRVASHSNIVLFIGTRQAALSASSSLVSLSSLKAKVVPYINSVYGEFTNEPALALLVSVPTFSSTSLVTSLVTSPT